MVLKSAFWIVCLTAVTLHAAFLDDDMDGVANEEDRCPNSAITDIVGADGCAVDKVVFKKEHHFDFSIGYVYSRVDSNTSQDAQSLSLGYHYGDFSAYLYTSNYNLQTGASGVDDTTLAFYYRRTFTDYALKAGIGGYIPSDSGSGNRTDYFFTARATRYLDLYDLSAEYQHTFMQDDATTDSDRLTLSLGYIPTQKSYTSLSWTTQTSIYGGEEALQNISLYASYFWSSHWFVSGEVSKGISDTAIDYSAAVKVGYYF
jgi:hypothetical protein